MVKLESALPVRRGNLLDLMRQYYEFDGIALNEQAVLAALDTLLSNPSFGLAFFIQHEEKTVGYIILTFGFSLEFHGRYAFVDELFIEEQFRGRGIGSTALQLAESEAQRRGMKALHLEVELDNVEARRLYQKKGFEAPNRGLMYKRLSPRSPVSD